MSETESFIVVIDGGSRRGNCGRGCGREAVDYRGMQQSNHCSGSGELRLDLWVVRSDAVDLLEDKMIGNEPTNAHHGIMCPMDPVELFQLRTASLYGGTNNIFSLYKGINRK